MSRKPKCPKRKFDMTIYELQAEISKTLAHPLRIAILHYLKDGEKTVNPLTEIRAQANPTSPST